MHVSIRNGLQFLPSRSFHSRLCVIGLSTFLLCSFFASQVRAEATDQDSVATFNTLVIQMEPMHDLSAINAALKPHGMSLGRVWPEFGLAEVYSPTSYTDLHAASESAVDAQRRVLQMLPGVQHVELDRVVAAAGRPLAQPSNQDWTYASLETVAPTDSLNAEQWVHERLNVFESWDISRGNPSVAIAVIDSGYDINHEDINADSLWTNVAERHGTPGIDDDSNGFIDDLHGWDWVENDDITNDPYGHGTHVGGAIAADTDNDLGISSLGPNLRIAPLRVLDGQGIGLISDLIDAIYYAYQQDIRVVNMSLVIQINSNALQVAVEAAASKGMVLVAASGNHSTMVSWPAKYPETVAVAATDPRDARGAFSNFGPETDLAAPGVDILSTYRDNSYHSLSGTSMSAAHVSALAALILSLRPDLSADELRSLLRDTSLDVNDSTYPGEDDYLGAGRVDYLGALSHASADLQLQAVSTDPIIAFGGESATARIAVAADEKRNMAVGGAVVQYELLPSSSLAESDGSDTQTGQVATSADGIAAVTFAAPDRRGTYVLRVQVGLAVLELPVNVVEQLTSVELHPPQGDLKVGDTGVPLRIEVRDRAGKSVSEATIVNLKTDMGRFSNGRTEMDVNIGDSMHTLFFHPGHVAGTATVTAQLRNAVQKFELAIAPEQAARIALANSVGPVRNWSGSDSSPIHFNIADRYGNPVADGTPVHLVVDRGILAETRLASRAGSVTATLTVPSGVNGPVRIWAAVPGTSAEAQVNVPLMSHVYWLPLLSVN